MPAAPAPVPPYPGPGRGRRPGDGGTSRWAVAALVLGLLAVIPAAVVAAVLTVNSHVATRQSAGGPITKPGDLGVFALTTGDCFDNPAQSANITSVTALPCTQPHDAQVYAAFRLSGADDRFPGQAAVDKPDGWAQGDRTIDCLIVSPAPTLTSSVLRM